MMATAVQNANYLKEHGSELYPRGPLVEVVFEGDGPIGMHIVNVSSTDETGNKLPDRVVVASTAEGVQAENRVFFGDQVMQINEVVTKGLKMKEVKLLIADAERPVKITLQPLCIIPTRHENFPLCPPIPETFKDMPEIWGLVSRHCALVEVGPPRTIKPNKPIEYYSQNVEYVFVRSVSKENSGLIEIGDRIMQVDEKRGKEVLQGLVAGKYPGSEVIVQKVQVSGTVICSKCQAKEWIYSLYCSKCGTAQKKRRG